MADSGHDRLRHDRAGDAAGETAGETAGGIFDGLIAGQAEALRDAFEAVRPPPGEGGADDAGWTDAAERMQALWQRYQAEVTDDVAKAGEAFGALDDLRGLAADWLAQMPLADTAWQQQVLDGVIDLWRGVLTPFADGAAVARGAASRAARTAADAATASAGLPWSDPRFADAPWREQPFYAMLHQTYLFVAQQLIALADGLEGVEPARKQQMRFATQAIVDALNPANFPLTNPVALARAAETRGQSLIKGMENLLADLSRGQLTHTRKDAFSVGENIAVTPGKVILETPLFQLIQYTPTTETVLAPPLVIFPPWINRFYILDLNPRKSLVRWAVEHGLTVFMVSWRSADESLRDLVWDDYVEAQIAVLDFVRDRLKVPAMHTVGYCVAGTTLAATLAVLAARGEAARVASATFFTAQVDFLHAGDLKHFIEAQTMEAIGQLGHNGYIDGRYLAATFNLLRGDDLIWNYVRKHYLLGEDYPTFDLLFWNSDVTNLPARWHRDYLRDLYRDNRLVEPGSLSIRGTPIDLTRIATPCYIQAGKEDHIAPARSVWQLTRHLAGPWTFVLAGSGHIAGVINPPAVNKYQFWTNPAPAETIDEFVDGAHEQPGSWWPHWLDWLRGHDAAEVAATGARQPGTGDDPVIEDAPGRYVKTR